jgi:glycosyltransferase involved in cell wall biosynthesis
MEKKTIVWLTPDPFIDVDLPIIPYLLDSYNIRWIIQFGLINRFQENEFDKLKGLEGLKIEFFYVKHKGKDPRRFLDTYRLIHRLHSIKADAYYVNIPPDKPFHLPLCMALPKDRTIITAHDGSIKSIMKPAWLVKWCLKKGYGRFKYVQMFSRSQAEEFGHNFPGHDVTVIPLALKDYGKPTENKRTDCISFLAFGTMHSEKNIGLLIDAADQLYDEGMRGFKVSIDGVWRENWNIYERVKHQDIFEIFIEMVPNNDIPNLFESNHYCVLPYKMMSQSGAIKVAYNYYNPVIVSDLPGFRDEVIDGTDGYYFKSDDVDDLKSVMKSCITDGVEGYMSLREKMT